MTMSLVQQFMTDRSILVTGFTGFIGKLLVAKLLTSCSDIGSIYVLIRKKDNSALQDRLSHALESKVFDKLRESNGNLLEKILPVEGDLTQADLGLNEQAKKEIIQNVSIVFHLGQLSNCYSRLKDSVDVNVHAVRQVLTFTTRMSKLTSVIHLSTIYANCNHPTIGEIIYQPALHPKRLLDASEWVTDDVFCDMEKFLMKGHANSFTYTKALAEYLIQEEFSSLPVSIVRPAVIGCTWREPFPDWIDSPNGIVPMVYASGKGQLRVLKGNPKLTAELIPADTVVNMLIAASWYRSVPRGGSPANSIQIFNLTSNAGRRLTWQSLEQIVCSSFRKNPLDKILRIPTASMTANRAVYSVKGTLFHIFPAYIADVINILLGRSPHFVAKNKEFLKLLNAAQYFTCRDWMIENTNVKELMSKMSSADKKLFGIDTSCTHWPSYIEGLCLGVKQYVAKEPLSGLPAARKALNRIRWADRFWLVILFLIFIRLASTRVQWAKRVWSLILASSLYMYNKIPKSLKA